MDPRNKEFQKSKMSINVFKLSCREFFSGNFKTYDFFPFEIFSKKIFLRSNFHD
jgi:hypothetical protein